MTAVSLALATVFLAGEAPAVTASRSGVRAVLASVSRGCPGSVGDLEQATDSNRGYVYEAWEGCDHGEAIGFARSTNGGASYSRAFAIPQSEGGWDPSVAVAPNGTVYAAFVVTNGNQSYPVVAISYDHGQSFARETALRPPAPENWGDAAYIAVGPEGRVYVTWDYGPSESEVTLRRDRTGSWFPSAGDVNVVIQSSTDGGLSFGAMSLLSPGYPDGGADSAPLVVEPSGKVDVLYQGYSVTNPKTLTLGPGYSYFTSSSDHGRTWRTPIKVGASAGTMIPEEWWMDGSIGIDAAGDLYATWDTQGSSNGAAVDVAWLSYSTDGGHSWSAPVRASEGGSDDPHITQVTGGPAGIAYVAWVTGNSQAGYARYLRVFAIKSGAWLSKPVQIGAESAAVTPGDTFGLSTLSPAEVVVSWDGDKPSSSDGMVLATTIGTSEALEPSTSTAVAARHRPRAPWGRHAHFGQSLVAVRRFWVD